MPEVLLQSEKDKDGGFAPELLCRRNRDVDGDRVNGEYAVREDLAFQMRTDSWVASI